MKVSEQWLRLWVNADVTTHQLAEKLTMAGLEISELEPAALPFSGIIIGKIVNVRSAEGYHINEITVGGDKPLTIVSRGPALSIETKVAVAREDATLATGQPVIAEAVAHLPTQGKLCTAADLGLAEHAEDILILPTQAPIGHSCWDYFDLDDQIIAIDLTPNRGDCLSIAGIAREVGALYQIAVARPHIEAVTTTIDDVLPVTIAAPADCSHYVGRVIKHIHAHAEVPLWMQERLRRSGLRSVSPVVDVTNYVMLELGQPMHAYDLDTIKGGMVIRRGQPSERLTLLDGRSVDIDEDVLIIADDESVIDLAGIMGGQDTAVSDTTEHIFLESAYFEPLALSGRARRLGLSTDASHRFERGVDPQLQTYAMERATELLVSIVGGEVGPLVETRGYDTAIVAKTVTLRSARIVRLLGISLDNDTVETILSALGMTFEANAHGWFVTVPSWRFDITLEVDLIEELARVYGYHKITGPKTQSSLQATPVPEAVMSRERCQRLLVDNGYQEIITYSFVDPKLHQIVCPQQTPLTLLNPIASELSQMRTSLWVGLIDTVMYNVKRQQSAMKLFETGLCFNYDESVLQQQRRIAGVIYGSAYPQQWGLPDRPCDYYDVKGDVERLCAQAAQLSPVTFKPEEHLCLHPGQSVAVYQQDTCMGYLGALHPFIAQTLEIKEPMFLFELNLAQLTTGRVPKYKPLSKFPCVRRDLALLVDAQCASQHICDRISQVVGELAFDVQVFDVYDGQGVEPGSKSIAVAITLQHPSRTLLDKDVNDLMTAVVVDLGKTFDAQVRD